MARERQQVAAVVDELVVVVVFAELVVLAGLFTVTLVAVPAQPKLITPRQSAAAIVIERLIFILLYSRRYILLQTRIGLQRR